MSLRTAFAGAICLFGFGVTTHAQTTVEVIPAEMAAGFAGNEGSVVLVSDQLVFVDADDPGASFALSRANVTAVDREQDVVTVSLRTAVRSQRQVRFRLDRPAEVVGWYNRTSGGSASAPVAVAAGGSDLTFQVRHDHLMGGCNGRLIVMQDRLAFESLDERNDSRQWVFSDISELTQDGIYKLKVRPFIGNEYNFELVGRGMDSQQFRELSSKIAEARAR